MKHVHALTKVVLPCRVFGEPLDWSIENLQRHLDMLERGEHAACACGDDHAFGAPPWDPDFLRTLIRYLRVDVEREETMALATAHITSEPKPIPFSWFAIKNGLEKLDYCEECRNFYSPGEGCEYCKWRDD